MTADPTSCLLRAAHAVTRECARHWIWRAVDRGLPLADARKALAEWDRSNRVQRVVAW